jgi:hypothetical protein
MGNGGKEQRMPEQAQPRKPTVTRNYLGKNRSSEVADNYAVQRELSELLKMSKSGPLNGYRVAHLYTDDDFNQHCVYQASEVKAAAAGKPALWVIIEFQQGDVDVPSLDAQLAKYGLQLLHAFERSGFWK